MEPSFRLKMTLENVPPSILATPPFLPQVNLLFFLAGSKSVALHQCPRALPTLAFCPLKIIQTIPAVDRKQHHPSAPWCMEKQLKGDRLPQLCRPQVWAAVPGLHELQAEKSFLFCVTYSAISACGKEASATLPFQLTGLLCGNIGK